MMYLPEKDYDLPDLDLLSLIFDSPLSWSDEDTILHQEAARPSNFITKSQARTITKRLINILRSDFNIGRNGPGKDVVVCITSGQILSAPLFYGVIGAGGVFSSASYAFTPAELARQIKQGSANLLIASVDCQEVAVKAAKDCGIPPQRVLILESMGDTRRLSDVTGQGKNYLNQQDEMEWERITDRATLENRLICLLYSSGTTGPPKGVNLSHQMVVSEALLPTFQDREYYAKRRQTDPSYKFQFRTVAHLPTAHIAGVQGYFINPAVAGGTVYWMPKFDFPKFLEVCKSYKITMFFTVPPIYLLIAKHPLVKDHFHSLEHAICGAAPLGFELQALAEKKLGCTIGQTWGLSETTGSFTRMPWAMHDATGGISPLLPNMRLRIVDDDNRDVDEGQEGEFIVKGPVVTKGYYRNENATQEAFTSDGWFKTGDVGIRRDHKFYIVDRKKVHYHAPQLWCFANGDQELIKYKGLQVAPAELEAHLLSHDQILDAAVIGVPDPDGSGNELPRAYVVADKSRISEEQIKDFVRSQMASHKQLRGGVIFMQTIPKSASGKILRRELREAAKQERKQDEAKL